MTEEKYLSELNPAQRQAVNTTAGPVLIIAGAGAGKTKTITYRILHLIRQGTPPENILAITFTNKAASEMKMRVRKLLLSGPNLATPWGDEVGEPFMSTFHALGAYILRRHANAIGLNRYFSIADRDDSLKMVKESMKQAAIDEKQFEPRKILAAISREKGKGISAADYAASAGEFFPRLVTSVWLNYEKILHQQKSLDFDDLLLKTVNLFKRDPEIARLYQERWRYIHIDEYQDTNQVQYELATILASAYKNICVVGDIDQSIYSWRGADYTNILNFEEDYPDASVIVLEENYRSTQNILAAANEVIKKNVNRREKNLFTRREAGSKITLSAAFDEAAEARWVASRAKELIENGISPAEIAVLYRANFQSRVLEEAFLREALPYQVLGVRFFERKEIKDMLAYLKLALNPEDYESLKRVINVPPRGIGKATLAKMAGGQETSLPPRIQEKISAFNHLLARIKAHCTSNPPAETIKFILKESGLESALKEEREEGIERLENIRELVTLATKYNDLPPEEAITMLLTEAALVSDQDTLEEARVGVRLMTVHASKGLEFGHIFITGLEQDLFPHAGLSNDEKRDDEEERRLFYVALTRAKEKLHLSYAQMRTIFGSRQMNIPSEFIFDISEDLIEVDGAEDQTTTNYIDF